MKPGGRGRKITGIVLLILGVLPTLAGTAIEAKNISNAQQQIPNNDFGPKAWHNLESDEIFPDYLTNVSTVKKNQGWSRQGIAKEASCSEALVGDFAQAVEGSGCETVLRATYADSSGAMSATVALIVVGSYENAGRLGEEFRPSSTPGPLVMPFGIPDTASDKWIAVAGGARRVGWAGAEPPYVLAISVGTTEPTREIGTLPEPWSLDESYELERWSSIGSELLNDFNELLTTTKDV